MAMIDDKLFERFPKPEVILGQHVLPPPAGKSPTGPESRSPRRTTSR